MARCDIEKLKADLERQHKERAKIRKRIQRVKDVAKLLGALLAAGVTLGVVGGMEHDQIGLLCGAIIMGVALVVLWLISENVR